MTRFQTVGLVSLCGLAVAATVDSAFGLGGGALLADICRVVLEGGASDSGMGAMQMDVKPFPLIALSLVATVAAIVILSHDHRRALSGQAAPTGEERAAILSAIIMMAAVHGRTSREEIRDGFKIVTGHGLEAELADLAFQRFQALREAELPPTRLTKVTTHIGRRRAIAAALLFGCVLRPATTAVSSCLEGIIADINATSRDIEVARQALDLWRRDITLVQGVSPITVLRHRSLALTPV